jgi:hypothetical protein
MEPKKKKKKRKEKKRKERDGIQENLIHTPLY